jgi:LacI family transcriptional regulator
MPTIFDIAKKANVSVMTVSRVLNNPEKVSKKTIQKIYQVMDDFGYQPSHIARSLVKKKTNTIGIIMPDIKNTFFNSWFRAVEGYALKFGYNPLLCNTDENSDTEMKFVRTLQAQRVDGILIVPHSKDSVDYLIKSNAKFVLVDRKYDTIENDFITTDHYAGAYIATEYLLKLGHKEIAVLKGPGILFPDVERYRSFCKVMNRNKIPINPSFIKNCRFEETVAFETVINMLQQKNIPTAIFSFNSLMTIGAIKAIDSLKMSIPDDISLIGFDSIAGQEIFKPAITHILQPVVELGEAATKILIDKIEDNNNLTVNKVFLKPKLVTGNSVKKIN